MAVGAWNAGCDISPKQALNPLEPCPFSCGISCRSVVSARDAVLKFAGNSGVAFVCKPQDLPRDTV